MNYTDQQLNDEINALGRKHGKAKLNRFMKKLGVGNKAIPPDANSKRAMYNFLRASYPPDVVISPSFLRSDIVLAGNSTYKFSVLESDGNQGTSLPTSTTVRLNQNDTFEMTHIAVMITKQTGVVALQQSPLYTYPNPTVFAGAGESAALQSVYFGGNIQLTIGTDQIYPKIDVMRFYRVPTSQKGLAVSTAAADNLIFADGFNNAQYPWDEAVPGVTISGNAKVLFTLNIPEAVQMAPPVAGTTNYVSLYLRGFLCANGAKQENKKLNFTY